jgi:hypothetical protein
MEGGSGGGATTGIDRRRLNRERKGKGAGGRRRGPDRWGHPVSVCRKKKKRRRRAGLLREGVDGPVGCWVEGKVRFPFLFSFLFQTLFKLNLFNSNSNQNFSNFFTTFYKPFRLHTSNQKPCIAK